jgi:NADH:ubiquinone oxidoreductase subunit 6 (subunit J)
MFDLLQQYWTALLPAAVGFAGIYLLLPRLQKPYRLLGAALAGVGLLAAGLFLVGNTAVLPETILFYAFSGLAILGGGLMLAQHNPVHAALSFALVVLSTCGLFLLLAAPFLMAATIIVYAGAIVVTFLFVIMLAQQAGLTSADRRSREPFLACLAGFVLLTALLCVLQKTYDTQEIDALLAKVEDLAQAKSEKEIIQVLGDPMDRAPGKISPPLFEKLEEKVPHFQRGKADLLLIQKPMPVAKLAAFFKELTEDVLRVRNQMGAVRPSADLPLSPFSGFPPNQELPKGKVIRELPARNVAGLGKTLFTDHLLAVELAGTLLLVASIGAIAIAARQREGLR